VCVCVCVCVCVVCVVSVLIRTKNGIRVSTMNLYFWFDRYWLRRPLLIDTIQSFRPDVLCVQEAIDTPNSESTSRLLHDADPQYNLRLDSFLEGLFARYPILRSQIFMYVFLLILIIVFV